MAITTDAKQRKDEGVIMDPKTIETMRSIIIELYTISTEINDEITPEQMMRIENRAKALLMMSIGPGPRKAV